jgi:hypothetical protein
MRSIIPGDKENWCFICGSCDGLEEHHIFGGSDRQVSEKYGLKVHLCNAHHHGTNGAHGKNGAKLQKYLHETGQQVIEQKWIKAGSTPEEARERFMKEFRKSYL